MQKTPIQISAWPTPATPTICASGVQGGLPHPPSPAYPSQLLLHPSTIDVNSRAAYGPAATCGLSNQNIAIGHHNPQQMATAAAGAIHPSMTYPTMDGAENSPLLVNLLRQILRRGIIWLVNPFFSNNNVQNVAQKQQQQGGGMYSSTSVPFTSQQQTAFMADQQQQQMATMQQRGYPGRMPAQQQRMAQGIDQGMQQMPQGIINAFQQQQMYLGPGQMLPVPNASGYMVMGFGEAGMWPSEMVPQQMMDVQYAEDPGQMVPWQNAGSYMMMGSVSQPSPENIWLHFTAQFNIGQYVVWRLEIFPIF